MTSRIVLDGLRILVVDDEADTRELLKQGLEYCGAKVRVAGSAAEAVDALVALVPDILISDIGMPGIDGYDLIRQVRRLAAGQRRQSSGDCAYGLHADRRSLAGVARRIRYARAEAG